MRPVLTHGALFEGYGGTSMAAAAALNVELDTKWYSEIKPASMALLEKRMPDVPNLGDIKEIDWIAADKVDVLTGSWPCQPHSSAGKRLGLADPRALWPNVIQAIDFTRPAIFLGENVARITTNGELRRVVRSLAEIGYVGAWRCITAASVGAPHKRDRCFLVAIDAYAEGERWAEGLTWATGFERGSDAAVGGDRIAADTDSDGLWDESAGDRRGEDRAAVPARPGADGENGDVREPHAARIVRALLPTPTERLGSGKRGLGSAENGRKRLESGRRNLDDAISAHCLNEPADQPEIDALSDAAKGRAGSLLPTPTARDGGRGAGYGDQPGRPLSETVHRLLPTPTARNTTGTDPRDRPNGLDLQTAAARLLPTHRVSATRTSRDAATRFDSRSGPSLDQALEIARGELPREFESWAELPASWQPVEKYLPTPIAGDAKSARNNTQNDGAGSKRGNPGMTLSDVVYSDRWGPYAAAIVRWEQVLGRPAPEPTQPSTRKPFGPQLSPRFVEWMMGLPEGHVTEAGNLTPRGLAPAERNAQLSLLGDGVCPQQGEAAFRDLLAHLRLRARQ
jgi:DNA (cytosine-5)-methyltransferase 1